MKTIAITGVSGFVGRNLVEYFKNENFKVIHLDLRNIDKFSINEDVDVVIHLAGKAHDLNNTSNPDEYYYVNFELTKIVYDAFYNSKASKFVFLSSIKAAADSSLGYAITEEDVPVPTSIYGKSKLLAENYILNNIHLNKKIFILRPTLIHGKDNKGNFKLLDKFVNFRIPWPFKAFENKRSFCTLDNLLFIINELVIRDDIKLGIYNICDNEFISTNELVDIIAKAKGSSIFFFRVPRKFIYFFFNIFDFLGLPINNSTLLKITGSLEVSNKKIIQALNKNLPYNTRSGLKKSFLKS